MNNNIYTTYTHDVQIDNDVYNINNRRIASLPIISAMNWIGSREDRAAALSMAFKQSTVTFPDYIWWLLDSSGSWEKPTRLREYWGLWKYLDQSKVLKVPDHDQTIEKRIEREGKVQYFGAKSINTSSVSDTVSYMKERSSSYLVLAPHQLSIEQLLKHGWNADDINMSMDLIEFSLMNECVFMTDVGHCDDTECGFVALGSPMLISKIMQFQ